MMARLRTTSLSVAVLALALTACDYAPPAPGIAVGEELYETCAPCHGPEGAGNPEIEAPTIAGLPQWYVEAQLRGFQAGFRGKHPEDIPGMRMRPMAVTLNREGDIPSVSEFVASLPPSYPESTLHGNAGAGAGRYEVCAACHGIDGLGEELLSAPPIVQMPDWYLFEQLRKFKSGTRGSDPADTWGLTMRVNAVSLDDQAMRDVIAYVQTLR